MTRFLSKLQGKAEEWLTLLAAVAVGAMMVITTADVVMRRVFEVHVKGSYVFVALLFVFVIFFGLAYAQRQDAHISIGVVYDRLPRKARRPIEGVALVISLVLFCLVTWYSAQSAWFNFLAGDTLLGAIPVVTWPSRFAVPVGAGLLSLRFLVQIIRLARRGELFEEAVIRGEAEKRGTGI